MRSENNNFDNEKDEKKYNNLKKDFRAHLKEITFKYKESKNLEEKKEKLTEKEFINENTKEKEIITTSNSHLTSEISFLRENTQKNELNDFPNSKSKKNTLISENINKIKYINTETPEILRKYNEYKNILDMKILELKKRLSLENNKIYNDIEEINTSKIKINLRKFKEINKINIKQNPFIIFIQMLDSKDLYSLFKTCKEIKQLIINSLIFEVKTYISNKYEQLSREVFTENIYYLNFNKENNHLQIFLIIKSKLTSKILLNKSIHLQYYAKFPCDKGEYVLNHFIFDIKSKELHFWIMKESTTFHQDKLNKAYFMHIMQYKLNDYAEFTINIFTDKGLMNIRKLKWEKIKIFKTPKEDYYEYNKENILKREIVDYDMSRYCELEICKGNWNDIIMMDNENEYKKIINLFNYMFNKNFQILKILFDDVGYYIFKIYLKATVIGDVLNENYIGIKIKIKNINDFISNECKKNNLIFDRKNEIEMHINDILVYYFSKDKNNSIV